MTSKSQNQAGLLAVFKYLDDVCEAADHIKHRPDFHNHEVYSPASYHELMHIAEARWGSSEVKWFTLVGALTGVFSGFGLCLFTDYDWPIIVGGKMAGIYSLPAYVIFGFELMILFGAIATIKGMLIMGRLPNPKARVLDTRLMDDHFAIFVPGVGLDSAQAKLLQGWGAQEIRCLEEAT